MNDELSLAGLQLDGREIDLGRLRAGTMLGLMGSPDSTTSVVLSAAALPHVAPPPRFPTGRRSGRLRVRSWMKGYLRKADAGSGEAASAADPSAALTSFGLRPDVLRRRLDDLDATDRARLALAAAWASGAKWLTLIDPFGSVPGHLRTGLRGRFAELVAQEGRGVVFSSNSLTDHTIAEAGVADIEKDQLVALGSLEQIVTEPRGSLPAELSGVNVYSGLARKGWLSIGHSAVRARTELDGKVYVTLGWRAALLSLDEHDPAFTSATVFEAIVTGLRDRGSCLQAKLSPVDTEMGLALDVDLADLAGVASRQTDPADSTKSDASAESAEDSAATAESDAGEKPTVGFGVLHPGLGATISELRANVKVGTHVFVEVDTSALHAYPVE
ncbi:ABC transporter [Brevibacterium sp. JSBI002]|uniref:ABC transporter n=1 Tax=Brevibacterium sp. JSBI002 TaxID=2886045 RepID=UPI00222F36F8|nr:ABC transporter [Brevibacterium sp. JSBI002]UZD62109.1 ABC transporter [Brevibacterium sp. JSBI002]